MARQIALITGANKGIGFAIAESLSSRPNMHVLLGARSAQRGLEAVKKLQTSSKTASAAFLQLDVADDHSIAAAAQDVKKSHGGLDILVNNAGIAIHTEEVSEKIAAEILATNYFGAASVCFHFLPLMHANGRVVNMSSMLAAQTFKTMSDNLKEKFMAPDLTVGGLNSLIRTYLDDVAADRWRERGWPKAPYGVSKIGLSVLTMILARQYPNLIISHCCPGYVNTDMTEHKGIRTPEKGAETPVHCALLSPGSPSGAFFRDCKQRAWIS